MPDPEKTDDTDTIREAVACFDSAETLQGAIDELRKAGFDRAELSLLFLEKVAEEKLGVRDLRELADDPDAPRTSYKSAGARGDAEGVLIGGPLYVGALAAAGGIVAAGGGIAASIAAAVVGGGAGGAIGAVAAKFVGDRHAKNIENQLDRGGLLLWVRTWNAEREELAVDILRRNAGQDVHVHEIPASE